MRRRLRVVAAMTGIAAVVTLGSAAATTATAAPAGSQPVNLDSKSANHDQITGTIYPDVQSRYGNCLPVRNSPQGSYRDCIPGGVEVPIADAVYYGSPVDGPYGHTNCWVKVPYLDPSRIGGWAPDSWVFTGGNTCEMLGR